MRMCLECSKKLAKPTSSFCGSTCNIKFNYTLRKEKRNLLSRIRELDKLFEKAYGHKLELKQ